MAFQCSSFVTELRLNSFSACPDNNIFVYVNESALDRTPYIFVELHADDLQDCIHKCFGNQFCYSLKYESTAVEPCSLYYFAAYNCSMQKLAHTSKVKYNGGAITIDCLRCPANGDFGQFASQLVNLSGGIILSKCHSAEDEQARSKWT
ncbi:PAN domain protein [Oesophagostomum dentatum]|uniref:PAN domain protein n=1 Tax=Oesophagostomum dentatum TaxID=61180 RepID=A0A0B1TLL5_OESDE|nr:PAN domain protein [Oesophagostomum dentatum]